mgnify:CR=1 FL=1
MIDELKKNFDVFSEKVTTANYYQSIIDNTITSQLSDLYKANKGFDEPQKKDFISIHNLFYPHLKSGNSSFAGSKKHGIGSNINDLYIQHNRQNQWVLAEVYEAFEHYINETYVIMGYYEPTLWKSSELPSIEYRNDISAYRSKVEKEKKIQPRTIMSQLSINNTKLKLAESENTFDDINIRMAISVIENFRHLIVHKHGIIGDMDNFVKKSYREAKKKNYRFLSYGDAMLIV